MNILRLLRQLTTGISRISNDSYVENLKLLKNANIIVISNVVSLDLPEEYKRNNVKVVSINNLDKIIGTSNPIFIDKHTTIFILTSLINELEKVYNELERINPKARLNPEPFNIKRQSVLSLLGQVPPPPPPPPVPPKCRMIKEGIFGNSEDTNQKGWYEILVGYFK